MLSPGDVTTAKGDVTLSVEMLEWMSLLRLAVEQHRRWGDAQCTVLTVIIHNYWAVSLSRFLASILDCTLLTEGKLVNSEPATDSPPGGVQGNTLQ